MREYYCILCRFALRVDGVAYTERDAALPGFSIDSEGTALLGRSWRYSCNAVVTARPDTLGVDVQVRETLEERPKRLTGSTRNG
jgi:hypothetical protein